MSPDFSSFDLPRWDPDGLIQASGFPLRLCAVSLFPLMQFAAPGGGTFERFGGWEAARAERRQHEINTETTTEV